MSEDRLCTNFAACKDYQQSFQRRLPMCSGCQGDISDHQRITRAADKYINKLLDRIGRQAPEILFRRWMRHIEECARELDISKQEANFLLVNRLFVRTLEAENAVKLGLQQ